MLFCISSELKQALSNTCCLLLLLLLFCEEGFLLNQSTVGILLEVSCQGPSSSHSRKALW